jgi:hypothetical protein
VVTNGEELLPYIELVAACVRNCLEALQLNPELELGWSMEFRLALAKKLARRFVFGPYMVRVRESD